MKNYVGSLLQIRGAEQYVLQNGRGDGMHFLYVRNGLGLDAWISLDRAADVSRVTYKGKNMGYFSPCGYVAPAYYDSNDLGFLKSFTAGFFTTCGLWAVGSPCNDEGEDLPLHGTVSNIPAILNAIEESEEALTITVTVNDWVIFGRKLTMKRKYIFSYKENYFTVEDKVTNEADEESPYMIMYHCNMGYPLVSENSRIVIPNSDITARNEHSKENIETAFQVEKPQVGYEECCYYYDVKEKDGSARVGIYNSDIESGVVLSYDKTNLPCFTEWKMMGNKDYVIGLEPGNCLPDGRDVMRNKGILKFLKPEESCETAVKFSFIDNETEFEKELSV